MASPPPPPPRRSVQPQQKLLAIFRWPRCRKSYSTVDDTEFRPTARANNAELEEQSRAGHWRLKNKASCNARGTVEANRGAAGRNETVSQHSKKLEELVAAQVRHNERSTRTAKHKRLRVPRVRSGQSRSMLIPGLQDGQRVFWRRKRTLANQGFQTRSQFHEHEIRHGNRPSTSKIGTGYRPVWRRPGFAGSSCKSSAEPNFGRNSPHGSPVWPDSFGQFAGTFGDGWFSRVVLQSVAANRAGNQHVTVLYGSGSRRSVQ